MEDTIVGKTIGNINVNVLETDNKQQFFYLKASNKNVLPVLDFLDDSLTNFKTIKK